MCFTARACYFYYVVTLVISASCFYNLSCNNNWSCLVLDHTLHMLGYIVLWEQMIYCRKHHYTEATGYVEKYLVFTAWDLFSILVMRVIKSSSNYRIRFPNYWCLVWYLLGGISFSVTIARLTISSPKLI